MDLARYIGNILSKDNGKATKGCTLQYRDHDKGRRNDGRVQVPIDVAVEEPWARIVGEEADRDVVTSVADTHHIATHGVIEIVGRIPGATDHGEGVPMQVNGVLATWLERQHPNDYYTPILTGPPIAPPGIDISTLWFGARP